MRRPLSGAALALLFASAAAAAPDRLIDHHRIDSPRSSAGFSLRVALIRVLSGRFDYLEGAIERQLWRGTFSVDVRLAALSLHMPNPDHAEWAQSEEFFAAARHPWIRFHAEDVPEALLREGGALAGTLHLRGVTRPIAIEIEPTECDRPGLDCEVHASGEVRRSEFGMVARRFVVSDKVKLRMAIRVRAADPPS